jgi:hypothetical protein
MSSWTQSLWTENGKGSNTMTGTNSKRGRIILGAGGVAALAMVLLGILNKPAYHSLLAAAVMWSLASLSMIILGIAFLHLRSIFKTKAAYLAAAVLLIKAVLVVIPLFVVYKDAEYFMNAMQIVRSLVDALFLFAAAWVVYCGRPLLGGIVSRLITALLTIAPLSLIAHYVITWLSLVTWQSGLEWAFLTWVVILSTLLGTAGLGASLIWLAVRTPRG